MSKSRRITYSTKDAPTLAKFHASEAFVRGVRGPLGSGKSVACCMEILGRAFRQSPGSDGIRRTRWAIIRQTYPELKSTTIKTWVDWVPESIFGPVNWSAPITHKVKLTDKVEIEILFLALERPDDTKKLLSLELTGAWINEAREMPKAVLDAATGRVGRFPAQKDGGCTWSGIIMDTNAPDDDHWWFTAAEESLPEGWEFFSQPGGLDPAAENLPNLPPKYYERMCAGKNPEWIKVYVDNQYGNLSDGRPIWPEFIYSQHVSERPLKIFKGLPILCGMDFGLTPALVAVQVAPTGQVRVLDELVGESIGIKQFTNGAIKPLIANRFRGLELDIFGDPAGTARAQSDEKTCFEELVLADLPATPAKTNNFAARREAVAALLQRTIDGQPGFIVDKRCKTLIKALNGGYKWRRLQVVGEERYHDKPDKNRYSHVAEALQYVCLSIDGAQASENMTNWIPPRKRVV